MATGKEFEVTEVGINTPKQLPVEELTVGDVGYIIASIKNVDDSRVGDIPLDSFSYNLVRH